MTQNSCISAKTRPQRGFAMIDALTAIALAGLGFSALIETRAISLNIATITLSETEALFYAQTLLEEGMKQGADDITEERDGLSASRTIQDYYHLGVLDPRFEEVVVSVSYRKRRETDTITLRGLRALSETAS